MLVHITFEKLTGLKGEIEGDFYVAGKIDQRLPLVYMGLHCFRQDNKFICIEPVVKEFYDNYDDHFRQGTNFLIKAISGNGDAADSQNSI